MNERIRELIVKAGFPKFDEMYVVSDGAELEKFAELIVRECAELVASRPYIDDGNWSHPSTMIKNHFGVE